MQTAVLDRAHVLWVPAPEHLVHECIIVAFIVPRIDVLEPVPVLDKDLFEDVPVPRRFCNHQDAPSWRMGIVAVQLCTTPHQRSPPPRVLPSGTLIHLSPPGATRTSEQLKNGNYYTIKIPPFRNRVRGTLP